MEENNRKEGKKGQTRWKEMSKEEAKKRIEMKERNDR